MAHRNPRQHRDPSIVLRDLCGADMRGSFALERADGPDENSVMMSFASDAPIERWGDYFILDMAPQAVRMQRIKDGAPLLVNHDTDQQVGVLQSAAISKDKKLRAVARFSRSQYATEIKQDVQDGIRTKTSVAFRIHALQLESRKEDSSTYRITDWEPYEGSIVALPADISVGVGRSMQRGNVKGAAMLDENGNELPADGGEQGQEKQPQQRKAPKADMVHSVMETESVVRKQERAALTRRNANMKEFAAKFKGFGTDSLVERAVTDPDMTFDQFREQVLDFVTKRAAEVPQISQYNTHLPGSDLPNQNGGRVNYGIGAREMVHAVNLKCFRGIGELMGMKDHEAAYRAGMWARGVIFGDPDALRWCRDAGVQMQQGNVDLQRRTMTEGVFTSAGWLVPIEMETAIISNREQYGVARRICNVIPMSSSSLTIPRITSDITAYFVGEGTSGTTSDPGGDQVTLNLKDLMAYTKIGKSTAMDAVIPLAEMVAREQARAFAIKEDACLMIGDGTSTYGGIQGLITLLETAAYSAGRATTGSGLDTFPEITAADAANVIGTLPVYARVGARWLCSGVFEAMVFGRLKLSAGGNTNATMRDGILESDYAGFPVSLGMNMPAGAATDYTNKVMCILGNFLLGVAFGSGSGMMLTVDPYTLADQNLIRLITTERIDIVNHGVNKSTTTAGPIVCMYGNT